MNLTDYDVVEVYKLVLSRSIKRFPAGFWQRPEAPENAVKCTKYLIEELLHWTDKDIKEKLTAQTFIDNKLRGMLATVYNSSPYMAIDAVYPDKYKPWEIILTPNKYWNKETSIDAINWLIYEKLHWTETDTRNKLDRNIFKKYNLMGMLDAVYNGSPFNAITELYPNIKPWELRNAPFKYWNKQTAIEATKWLIKEKLKWNDNEIKQKLNVEIFKVNNLYGMLVVVYNHSPFEALNAVYPNKFKPWELKMTPHFWNETTAIEATKWLIEEKLKWLEEDIKTNLTYKVFINNGLRGVMRVFDASPFKAINATYPGKFKREDFKR